MTATVVLFATGSRFIADLEESCVRANWSIIACVQNVDGPVHARKPLTIVRANELSDAHRAHPFLVALFKPDNRTKAAADAFRLGFSKAAVLIDPTTIAPPSFAAGRGSYVNAGCTIGADVRLGEFAMINRAASVGHHCQIGDFASIGPGAVLTGSAQIGAGATVGAGAVILPEVIVGANSIVGAGSVVTQSLRPNSLAIGNPARVVGDTRDNAAQAVLGSLLRD